LVDLVNNLDQLAEDPKLILEKAKSKATEMDKKKFFAALNDYGNAKTKKLLYCFF